MTLDSAKPKSVNISVRLDSNLHDLLVEDAKIKGISLNSLVNSIAKRHIAWQRFAEELGFVPITKRALRKIFENIADDKIEELSKNLGGIVPRELIFLQYDKFNFDNLMQVIEINGTRFGSVKHSVDGPVHNINIHHGVSEKFSKFLAGTHQAMADDLAIKLTVHNADKNMVCMEIIEPEKAYSE